MKIVKSLTNASFSFSLSLSVYPIHFLHQRGATSGNKYRLADKLRTMPELEERGKHSETLDSGRFFDLVINLRQTISTCTSLKFCQAIYRVSRFRPNCFFLFSFYFFRFLSFLFFFLPQVIVQNVKRFCIHDASEFFSNTARSPDFSTATTCSVIFSSSHRFTLCQL